MQDSLMFSMFLMIRFQRGSVGIGVLQLPQECLHVMQSSLQCCNAQSEWVFAGVPAEGADAAAQAQGIGHVPTAALLLRHAGVSFLHCWPHWQEICVYFTSPQGGSSAC